MSHQQAIGVLQQTSGEVELIVARGGIPRSGNLSRTTSGASSMLSRTPSDVSTVSRTSVTVPVSKSCHIQGMNLVYRSCLKTFFGVDSVYSVINLINRMWLSVVCALFDNKTPHHSGQNFADSQGATE